MTEHEMRARILELVREYCAEFHNREKKFTAGDRIPYASRVYDGDELTNLVDSALDFWLTAGRYVDEFEKKFREISRRKVLLFGELRFVGEFDGVHDADFSAFGRTQNPSRRRSHNRCGRFSDDNFTDDSIRGDTSFRRRDNPAIQH